MKILQDVAATGYPNHTKELIQQVMEKGHKTIKTHDGTRLEGYKTEEGIIIDVSNPMQKVEETFLYKP
jgi:hypothetical protein